VRVHDIRPCGRERPAREAARRFRPDVVYAHFLVPTGLVAGLASSAPLVVTAHGRDVRNVGEIRGIAALTRRTVRRAATVIAVSDYLRRELEAKVPEAVGKTQVIDSGVDLERFTVEPAPDGGPRFLCIGALTERKNVVRLADAFERLAEGTLTFLGDGELRGRLEGRPDVELAGAVTHDEIPAWIARAHVICQPSLVEPFGQVLLEAMAMQRPVLGTAVGGPRELVTEATGALADPYSVESIRDGLQRAIALGVPNPAGRAVAAEHDLSTQVARIERVLTRYGTTRTVS